MENRTNLITFTFNKYFILFFANMILIIAISSFFYMHIERMNSQLIELQNLNNILLTQNLEIRNLIEQFQIKNIEETLVEQNQSTILSNDYRSFYIKIALILSCSCLAGFSVWYIYYWLKFLIYNSFAIPSINGFLNKFFYENVIESFSKDDKYGNVYTVYISHTQKTVEINIKPVNSETTYTLENYLEMNKEIFDNTNSLLNSIKLVLKN